MVRTKHDNSFAPGLAGFLGGAASTVVLYPLDLIKVRMQVNENVSASQQQSRRISSWRVFRAVVRQEGVLGLYQGLTPAVVGSSVSWGGYFFFYEGMKKRYGGYKQVAPRDFSPVESFLLACASGAIMVGITNPVWLIKTRMQLQLKQATETTKPPYKSMTDAARTIVREEGVMALYKGAIPALMLTSHGGVQFAVYEFLKKYFKVTRAEREHNISVVERFQLSFGFLAMGAVSKM